MFEVTADEIFEKYPMLMDILKQGHWRKYELQDILMIPRAQVDVILSTLMREGLITNTSQGWKWV